MKLKYLLAAIAAPFESEKISKLKSIAAIFASTMLLIAPFSARATDLTVTDYNNNMTAINNINVGDGGAQDIPTATYYNGYGNLLSQVFIAATANSVFNYTLQYVTDVPANLYARIWTGVLNSDGSSSNGSFISDIGAPMPVPSVASIYGEIAMEAGKTYSLIMGLAPQNGAWTTPIGSITLTWVQEGSAHGFGPATLTGVFPTGTVPVPGPEAGAGIGAVAMGGMAVWLKRRRKEEALAV